MISGLLFIACKKSTSINHQYLDPGLVAHFNFKPGSYWIFRDSATGNIDSFCVKTNSLFTQTYGSGLQDVVITNFQEYTNRTDTNSWQLNLDNNSWYFYAYYNTKFNTHMEQFPVLGGSTYPFALHPVFASGIGRDSTIMSTLANYTVQGTTYTNVWQIIDSTHNLSYNHNDCFYISDSVWVIKFSLNHPQDSLYNTWELVRCNIVR